VTICPCCGFKSESDLSHTTGLACASCGACAVGEPLPRPEHELPSFGRSLLLAVIGSLTVLLFLVQTVIALAAKLPVASGVAAAGVGAINFWLWVASAETAAWRLKWAMIPIVLLVAFGSRKLYRSVAEAPDKFCGIRAARRGYLASAAVPLLVLVLIGITVPERLRQRQLGIEAGFNAQGYRIDRALVDYQKEFGTLPDDLADLNRLSDTDGSLAAALKNLDTNGYKPSAELAAAPTKNPQRLRGAVIMKASADADDEAPTERLSFTNYELQLPGSDKVLGTEDDLLVRDGVISKASDAPRRVGSTTVTSKNPKR
jgi:hypothetical protein